jgi:hypothetical protein
MQNGGFWAKNGIFGRHLTKTMNYKLKLETKTVVFFLDIAKASKKTGLFFE